MGIVDRQLALDLGRQGRDAALDLLEETRAEWLERARGIACDVAHRKGYVTADDIHEFCPPPSEFDPRVIGAVFQPRMFVKVGMTQTGRPEAHARPIALFRLEEES